jgi:hypothetical protein
MKIVNINDIEDLILTKHEIDLMLIEDKVIKERTTINGFLETYAMPKNIYMYNGISIPFKLYILHDKKYLFVTNYNKQENEVLENKLKQIKYDMNNLVQLTNDEIQKMEDYSNENFIIINNHYYK